MISSNIRGIYINNKHKMKVIREIATATKNNMNAGTRIFNFIFIFIILY